MLAKQDKHVGIEYTTNAFATISARIKVGRQIAFMIMGAGFHGHNGASPKVYVHIIYSFILLAIMFRLKILKLIPSDYREISGFHGKQLHCIQHLPKATVAPALYILTSSCPSKPHITHMCSPYLEACCEE